MAMDLQKLAGSPVDFVVQAIHRHQLEHQGDLPKVIHMHPRAVASFRAALDGYWRICVEQEPTGIKFMGVQIAENRAAEQPWMLTSTGEVESL